ncbi:MAG TPA: hypothetical protein VK337_21070 [Xanthobacteraceae bacterium]|nr:hypothetical protein [Xanthobacteraceae bacterium]
MRYSLGREPWWNAGKRARSKRARAASQDAAVVTLRLPAFRFLHLFLGLIGRSSTDERKTGATPALSLDRTGFALDVTTFLQTRDPFSIVRGMKRGHKSAPRDGRVWP